MATDEGDRLCSGGIVMKVWRTRPGFIISRAKVPFLSPQLTFFIIAIQNLMSHYKLSTRDTNFEFAPRIINYRNISTYRNT
jgi:hypothetical protein